MTDVSSPSPQPTKSRVYRRIWKRKRSPGELQRRRQRQFDYQNTSTPCMPEPESKLESGSWEGGSVTWDWNSSDLGDRCFGGGGYSWGTPQGERGYVERSSNLNNSTVLSPPTPQNWWQPPCWAPTPSPGPTTPTSQPASPVYCDGCHSWGNLLTVTVSQARGP